MATNYKAVIIKFYTPNRIASWATKDRSWNINRSHLILCLLLSRCLCPLEQIGLWLIRRTGMTTATPSSLFLGYPTSNRSKIKVCQLQCVAVGPTVRRRLVKASVSPFRYDKNGRFNHKGRVSSVGGSFLRSSIHLSVGS